MSRFRVPYPSDPERRQAIFEKVVAQFQSLGANCQGTPDEGSFEGSAPFVGRLAGSYRSPAGSDELEIEIREKPAFLSMSRIESEVRKITEA